MTNRSLARRALLRLSRSRWLSDQVTRRRFVRRAVRRFMPGEDLGDALEAAARLARDGLGAVLTEVGENLTTPAEADAVRDHYLEVLERIAERRLDAHVSVKPTQLGLDFSFDRCEEHLESLAARAAAIGTTFWLDMEDSSYVDRTLELYRRLRAHHDRVGLALQAYLRRTPDDLAALLPLRPIVRLVKGAYAEPPDLAFPAKRDTDRAYFELGSELLAAAARGEALPIFGTHDLPLLDRLQEKARALGAVDGRYEIHMLYGIRQEAQRRHAASGSTVKTLISYGKAWFPWYMRRLAERPANVWFVVRSMLPS